VPEHDVSNEIAESREVRGLEAYMYAFKARAHRHHCLGYGTASIDVEALVRLHKRYCHKVRPITYTTLYVKATALALARNPEANAVLFRKPFGYRIVRFERVDVNLPITREVAGQPVTFIGTIRDAATKTLSQIQDEISEYQHCAPEESFAIRRIRQFAGMPLWLAKLIHWRMTWDPSFYVGNVGTCGLTFVEGDWFEHFFPIAPTSVVFGIGALRKEPVVQGGEIVVERRLKCALMIDNFVISGLTGAALARDFKELLESGSFVTAELEAVGVTV
jgi:pyruvate/2-oxoglutarate dehydrogenase complex dihydrolipoamide acyltransferase (E2) component